MLQKDTLFIVRLAFSIAHQMLWQFRSLFYSTYLQYQTRSSPYDAFIQTVCGNNAVTFLQQCILYRHHLPCRPCTKREPQQTINGTHIWLVGVNTCMTQCCLIMLQISMNTMSYRGFWWSENSMHILQKKMLLMTHLPISPILNAAELIIHIEIY